MEIKKIFENSRKCKKSNSALSHWSALFVSVCNTVLLSFFSFDFFDPSVTKISYFKKYSVLSNVFLRFMMIFRRNPRKSQTILGNLRKS